MTCTTSQILSVALLLGNARAFAPHNGHQHRVSSLALPMSYLESLTGEKPSTSSPSKSYSPFGNYKKGGTSPTVSSATSASTPKKSYSPFGSSPKPAAPMGGYQPGDASPAIEYEPVTAAASPSTPKKSYSPFGSSPKAAAPMGGYQPGAAAPSIEYEPATVAAIGSTPKKNYSPFGSSPKAAAPMGGYQPGAAAPSIEYEPATVAATPSTPKKSYSPFGSSPKAAAPMGGYQPGASAPSVEYSAINTASASPSSPKKSYSPFGSSPKAAAPMGGYQPGASAPSIEYQPVTPAPTNPTTVEEPPVQEVVPPIIPSLAGPSDVTLHHYADAEFFAIVNLNDKGPRTTADVGEPFEKSRKMADDGSFRVGSWYCSEGGWNSPNPKAHTEIFYVLEGKGTLSDADGEKHEFEAGDTVIIPKGHTGRWDIQSAIHKIWAVNDHAKIEETSHPIRVQVFKTPSDFAPAKKGACGIYYNVGPTKVGIWASKVGSYPVEPQPVRTFFHVLEGLMYVTDTETGLAHRCEAGDTVMMPADWEGFVDVVEPVKKIWTTGAVE